MKALLALMVTTVAFSAHALESHYGKLTKRGHVYTCSLTNKTNATLDMKYVEFKFLRIGGHGDNYFTVKNRIDTRVRTGEKIAMSARATSVQTAEGCRFIAR